VNIWAELDSLRKSLDVEEVEATAEQEVSASEFRRVALTVAYAIVNYCKYFVFSMMQPSDSELVVAKVNWDVERFKDHVKIIRQGEGVEDRAREELARIGKYFELPETDKHHEEPQTILDVHGRILVWSLPGILSTRRVVSFIPFFKLHILILGSSKITTLQFHLFENL
jgi:hypothetical protein